MQSQKGSAHVIIIVILVVALLCTLGFVFWQNFIKKDEPAKQADTTKTETKEEEKAEVAKNTKTYDRDGYSFEYPNQGWKLEEKNDYYEATGVTMHYLELQSDGYAPAVGMGIDSGAKVNIYTNELTIYKTVEEQKRNILNSDSSITNMKDITINGLKGYSYESDYEGKRSVAVTVKNDVLYQITYQAAINQEDTYRNAFDMVVNSFKVK